jgi:cytochrome d ubiquinol oxidase subunit II
MAATIKAHPVLFVVPLLTMLAVANVPRSIHHGRAGWAFISSSAAVFGLFGLVGLGMYPLLVRATDPALSLTIHNAASSPKTLGIMLTIALIGIPLVLSYTVSIYWVFRGKVKLDTMSY